MGASEEEVVEVIHRTLVFFVSTRYTNRNFFPCTMHYVRFAKNYLLIALLLVAGWLLSTVTSPLVDETLIHGGATLLVFFEIIVILIFGFLAYELAKPTIIPSFVLAIFIGMLQRHALSPLTQNATILTILTTIGAAFILFGGGLETPFQRFRTLVGPILSIAFFGTLITAFLFSALTLTIGDSLGLPLTIGAVVLLGAALASTDPAAIIPSLKSVYFPNPRVKDIAVSESAINDVVGAVLTGVFLSVLGTAALAPTSLFETYGHLLTWETGQEVLWELTVGCVVGILAFFILHTWSKRKAILGEGGEADAALFMAIPLLAYLVATFLHGSGFLAVFIAGLLFQLEDHVSHVSHYFNHTIEGLMKPLIFMLLGASVDIQALAASAGPGIILGLLFMFVVRPIAVFATLLPFVRGKHKMSIRELLFLSFVRETGVIPAVLLMGLSLSGIPGTETIVPIGIWIILLTLVLQPPFTPLVARLLKIAKDAPPFPERSKRGPVAVLCSRGLSFKDRLATVVDWAVQHHVQNIAVLHCPENKYSETFIKWIKDQADDLFEKINKARVKDGEKKLHFEFIGHPGLLQDNIRTLVEQEPVSIIFVGEKMLDYRLQDVKHLRVPFVFLP